MSGTDTHPAPGLTVRDHHDGRTLYVGGWPTGTYKTQRGLDAAIARHAAEGAECAARFAAAAAEPCPTCGARADAHYAPAGSGFMYPTDWHARNGAAAPTTTEDVAL